MWVCQGTEEVNPVPLCIKIYKEMGFDVFDYDKNTPVATKDDTLESYLQKFNKDLWDISPNLLIKTGDIVVLSFKNASSGKLFKEAGVTAGIILNDSMQMPLMASTKCPLKGIVTLRQALLEGYCLENIIRAKHFNLFTPITSAKDLVKVLKE